jgi:hypothetical protein
MRTRITTKNGVASMAVQPEELRTKCEKASKSSTTTAAVTAAVVSMSDQFACFPTAFHRSALVCGAAEVCTFM